jgi:hypothetical protein
MNNKYSNSKIYALRSYSTDEIYIGSTIQTLSKKMSEIQNSKMNVLIDYLNKYDDAYIELLENFPCKSKEELNKRQGELIRMNIKNVINRQMKKQNVNKEKRREQEKTLIFLRRGKPDDMSTEQFEKIRSDYINSLSKNKREYIS